MRAGEEVIYQAALVVPPWLGYADFLERVQEASNLGPWSYEAVDTKLPRRAKPERAIQLTSYSKLIGNEQGRLLLGRVPSNLPIDGHSFRRVEASQPALWLAPRVSFDRGGRCRHSRIRFCSGGSGELCGLRGGGDRDRDWGRVGPAWIWRFSARCNRRLLRIAPAPPSRRPRQKRSPCLFRRRQHHPIAVTWRNVGVGQRLRSRRCGDSITKRSLRPLPCSTRMTMAGAVDVANLERDDLRGAQSRPWQCLAPPCI
jgi:hypothetical protein